MEPDLLARFAASPLFGGVDDPDLQRIAELLEPRVHAAGDVIVRSGDLGAEMFWIDEGVVEVIPDDATSAVAQLGAGDCFGEMALIEVAPRCASVRAVTGARLWALRARDLRRLHVERPELYTMLVLNVARELSRRLRRADTEITRLRDALSRSEPTRKKRSGASGLR